MPRTVKNIILSFSAMLVIIACGPELTLQGSKVEVSEEAKLEQCRMLGSTRLSLAPTQVKLMKETDMKKRLTVEARNFAARIGGNAVLPSGIIEEGKQSFKIYSCPLPQ